MNNNNNNDIIDGMKIFQKCSWDICLFNFQFPIVTTVDRVKFD